MPAANDPTILVVDDSKVTRSVIKVLLMGRSFAFLEAEDGVGALRLISDVVDGGGTIDLVIADMNMPAMDGLTFLKTIRADRRSAVAHVDVVLITGDTSPELRRQALASGVCEIVYKPVSSAQEQLTAAVERALAKRRAQRV